MANINERSFICGEVPRNSFLFFEEMRNRKEFCDITFHLGGESISAHRMIIAAGIPHFRDMLLSKSSPQNDADIGIPDVEPNALKCLINFAYGCEVKINTDNVRDLLSAACSLGVTEVRKECCDFLADTLEPENALSTRLFAEELNCSDLLESTHCYIKKNFTAVSETKDFLKLPLTYLKELIDEDDLIVKNEEEVFTAVMKWTNEVPEDRSSVLPELLVKIRMPLIEPVYLTDIVKKERLVRTTVACRDLVDEAKNYNLFPQLRSAACSFRTESRYSFINTPSVEVEKRKLYLLSVETNRCTHCYDLLEEKWVKQANKKFYVNNGSAVEFQNNIYFFEKGLSFKYDSCNKTFQYLCQMPTARFYAGATSLQSKIYVCGGIVGHSASGTVECLDPEKGKWETTSSMPTACWGLCVVALGNHIYILGGRDLCVAYDLVQRYDPITKKWKVLPPMLSKRAFAGATVLNDKIYVCGGFPNLNAEKCIATAEVYDPFKNTWKYISPMNYSRQQFFLLSCAGKLHAIGGKKADEKPIHVSEIYDPKKDEWSSGTETDSTIFISGAVVI